MAYSSYGAYISGMAKTPKDDWRDGFQQILDDQFYNSSDWYTVGEETDFGSGVYSDVDVRINAVVSTTTGANQGDDWRKLLFKSLDKIVRIGQLFLFEDNYWLVVNTEIIAGLTPTVTVRRCNNTLRWISESGSRHEVPCVLDYAIQESRDYSTGGSKMVNPSGILRVLSQRNVDTNTIKSSDRFLFGNASNWTAYRLFGGGIHNFNNYNTLDMDSGHLLTLTMGVGHLNEDVDDLVNGYADNSENVYVVSLNYNTISEQSGQTVELLATLTLNGEVVSGSFEWTSSDESICTVDSSGTVTMISNGSSTISVNLSGDASVTDLCLVSVTDTPTDSYAIEISPDENFVYKGVETQYTATLLENGSALGDAFVFSVVSGGVPSSSYAFTVDGANSFSVSNVDMYLEEPLVIRCVSGTTQRDFEITLKGVW